MSFIRYFSRQNEIRQCFRTVIGALFLVKNETVSVSERARTRILSQFYHRKHHSPTRLARLDVKSLLLFFTATQVFQNTSVKATGISPRKRRYTCKR